MDRLFSFLENHLFKRIFSVGYFNGDWHGSLIEKDADDLELIESYDSLIKIEQALARENDIPILFTVEEKGVLWYIREEELTEEAVKEVFYDEVPSGNIDEFYVSFQENLLSIARRQALERILEPFVSFEDRIVSLSLAPSVGIHAARNSEGKNIVGGYKYFFNEQQLVDIQESDHSGENEFGDTIYSSHELVNVAATVDYFGRLGNSIGHWDHEKTKEALIVSNLLTKVKMPTLITLLIIVLINSVLFFQWSKTNSQLKEKSGNLEVLDNKLKGINEYILANNSVYNSIQASNKYSILADRIGATLPLGIRLSQLVINPELESRVRRGGFDKGKLIISGSANSTQAFTSWVSVLEDSDWVGEIEKQTYENDPSDGRAGEFTLIIRSNVEES